MGLDLPNLTLVERHKVLRVAGATGGLLKAPRLQVGTRT